MVMISSVNGKVWNHFKSVNYSIRNSHKHKKANNSMEAGTAPMRSRKVLMKRAAERIVERGLMNAWERVCARSLGWRP